MKALYIYKKVILPVCISVVGLLSSCSAFDDFLTVYPTNQITGEQFWENKTDLESVLFACYRQMASDAMGERMFAWGELKSDNFDLADTSSDNLVNLMTANLLPINSWFSWASFYKLIGYCNLSLSKGPEVLSKDNSFSEGDWLPIQAELVTMRALSYFYLVRAFRDVPFTVDANDTSVGATDPMPQVPSEQILTYLINDLEAIKDNGMTNYGNDADNHGRITRNAIYTLLADIYLWRASKNSSPDSIAVYGDQYRDDYAKCIECCNYVINAMNYKMNEQGVSHFGKGDGNTPELPLIVMEPRSTAFTSYNEVFGSKNSDESIFEVQYGNSPNDNETLNYFFGGFSGSNITGARIQRSTVFEEVSTTEVENEGVTFYKSDYRLGQTFYYAPATNGTTIPINIVKNLASGITVNSAASTRDDMTTRGCFTYSGTRPHNNIAANWIVYRASDPILMKAEAMAALSSFDASYLASAMLLTKAIFRRSNPTIQANRLNFSYGTQSEVMDYILRERQREFIGEGKRWFDLVRLAYRSGDTSRLLNILSMKFAGGSNAIKAKMATMNSLFNPVYREEMKVNTALVQNPAWGDDNTSERN